MLGALAYLMISGASFATVRSAIMISIMLFAVILDRPALALRNVVLAATLILVLFPESLFDAASRCRSRPSSVSSASTRHSGAVAVVRSCRKARRRASCSSSSRGIVLSTLVASAAVAPFAAYHFHKSQQYAVIANLIAIPLCNLVVMPAALATLIAMPLGLEALPLWVMGWGVDAMLWTARRVASLPGAVLYVPAIPTLAFLLMIGGGLWLALWQTRWRFLGAALIAGGIGARAHAAAARPADRRGGRARRRARRTDGLSAVGSARLLRARALARERRRRARSARSGEGHRLFLRQRRLPGRRQRDNGGGRAPSRRLLRRLPPCRDPRLQHRRPENLPGGAGGRRRLHGTARGGARHLHRGGRVGAHRYGGAPARSTSLVGARTSGEAADPAYRRAQ